MRVAHLTAFMHGGASALRRIHEGLRGRGLDSHVFATCHGESSTVEGVTHLSEIRPGKWSRTKSKWWPSPSSWQHRIDLASRDNASYEAFSPPAALRDFDLTPVLNGADVLHVHWTGDVIDYQSFFEQVQIPVVWTLHDQNPYLGGFHYQGDVDAATGMLDLEYECREIKREALSNLDLSLVGNSRWNSEQSLTTTVLPKHAKVQTIYLPLPVDDYQPLDKQASKKQLGIAEDQFVIGFACAAMGNRRKGFADLLSAIERLPTSIQQHTSLLSFGHPPSKAMLSRLPIPWLHQGQPSGGIEQSPIYSAMDVFVFPSIEEAFGQTALEALACQTPVIGTSVGGIPEMVIDGQTGLLTPPRSPGRLLEQMVRLYEDEALRHSMGVAGRELALKQHSPELIAIQHEELYQRAVKSHLASENAA
ncbi:Capsular glucan synthase [Rubripirellula obstinata]|uniref:Capsular glucan synthase n=1 Tax=Rubripirellula obstinata TaxID=406547 RepID=A0A5B1CMI3_9BACT|nr:glycosyltransferase [Rubripirellula obstinata]KAA1260989.1 Capsular glucan synthase [Rubripirellula obstinata]